MDNKIIPVYKSQYGCLYDDTTENKRDLLETEDTLAEIGGLPCQKDVARKRELPTLIDRLESKIKGLEKTLDNGKLERKDKEKITNDIKTAEQEVQSLTDELMSIRLDPVVLFLWTGRDLERGYEAIAAHTKRSYVHYSGLYLRGFTPSVYRQPVSKASDSIF